LGAWFDKLTSEPTSKEQTLVEPSNHPLPHASTQPHPPSSPAHQASPFSAELLSATRQATGPDSVTGESEPSPKAFFRGIFTKRVHMLHRSIPGLRVPVKLPDARRDLRNPLPRSPSPPNQTAPDVPTRRSRPHQPPATNGWLGLNALTPGARPALSPNQPRTADGWPIGIQFGFKASQPVTPPTRRKLSPSDFSDGAFSSFAAPGAARMQLPGFGSATLFTPPASADNTPSKQGAGPSADRPASPCEGLSFFLQKPHAT
jgi:hypothetical protein